jgi:hypothetical protein
VLVYASFSSPCCGVRYKGNLTLCNKHVFMYGYYYIRVFTFLYCYLRIYPLAKICLLCLNKGQVHFV